MLCTGRNEAWRQRVLRGEKGSSYINDLNDMFSFEQHKTDIHVKGTSVGSVESLILAPNTQTVVCFGRLGSWVCGVNIKKITVKKAIIK